jgi:hypothetical protein
MRISSLVLGVAAALVSAWAGTAQAETKSALATDGTGWLDLQPAADLSGWTRVPIPPTNTLGRAQWHVEQPALLVCDGDGGHDMLRFDKEVTNGIFHVEFRYMPVAGTNQHYNSGVFVRNSADGAIWHQAQLTLDGGYLFGVSPANGVNQRFKAAVTERCMKPAGEWNTIEVTARGKLLSVWLNGAQVCSYDRCEVPQGYLALEGEFYHIEFRHLKYKRLE